MPAFDPQREELVDTSVAAADPSGTGIIGRAKEVRLDREPLARPYIRWKDVVLEVDLYAAPGATNKAGGVGLEILLMCPKCSTPEEPHQLRISSDRKAIAFRPIQETDPQTGQPIMRGELSIEPFGCTWEMPGGRRSFGLSLCGWKVAVDKNVARDA